jgi:predicted metal-binding protein
MADGLDLKASMLPCFLCEPFLMCGGSAGRRMAQAAKITKRKAGEEHVKKAACIGRL